MTKGTRNVVESTLLSSVQEDLQQLPYFTFVHTIKLKTFTKRYIDSYKFTSIGINVVHILPWCIDIV